MTPDFRPIPNFPGYSITRDGLVMGPGRPNCTPGLLSFRGRGFKRVVSLRANGRSTSRLVHRLVKEAWGE